MHQVKDMEIENFQGLEIVNDKCQRNLKMQANAREISENEIQGSIFHEFNNTN